jgi:hypothetical protein
MRVWAASARRARMAIPRRRILYDSRKRRELLLQLAAPAVLTRLLFFRPCLLQEFTYLPALAALIFKYRHYITPDSKITIKTSILGICRELARQNALTVEQASWRGVFLFSVAEASGLTLLPLLWNSLHDPEKGQLTAAWLW